MKNHFNLLLLLVLISFRCLGQENPGTLSVNYISEEIIIDGVMEETAWQEAASISGFWQYFPTDSVQALRSTEVKILYNDETIYVGIGIYAESAGSNYVATSLQRDFSGASNDNVSVLFDTFSDGANAFLFGINSRLQWRFAPLSNLFLVYNDNYFPNGFGPKFRSINLKLTYLFTPQL